MSFRRRLPIRLWGTDITYLWTQQGWLYLAVVIDLYSRRVVGWSMDRRMKKALVIRALMMAVNLRKPPPGLISHSDRGSQYASHDYQKLLKQHGMHLQHEPQRQLLGQCPGGALLQQPETGMDR